MLYLYALKTMCETDGQRNIIKNIMNYGIQSCSQKNKIMNPEFNVEKKLYEIYDADCDTNNLCIIPKERYYKHNAARLNSFVLFYARYLLRVMITPIEKELNYKTNKCIRTE